MRNSSSLDWLRFMHTPNDYRVSHYSGYLVDGEAEPMGADFFLCLFFSEKGPERNICLCLIGK